MKKVYLFLVLLISVPTFAVEFTVTQSAEQIAEANNWKTGSFYDSFVLGGAVTVAAHQPDTGKVNGYYSPDSPRDWRMYQARNNGEFSISVPAGLIIKSVRLTYSSARTGVLSLVPGQSIDSANQVLSGAMLVVNEQSITLYAGNTGASTVGQVRLSAFSVTYGDSTSVVETFAHVVQTASADEGTVWQGDYADWQVKSFRRHAKDTLNNGVQATWSKSGGYLRTRNAEGGIKRFRFDWREFVNEEALLELAMSVGEIWKDTATIQATGVFPSSKNQQYGADVQCKQNAQLTFSNISQAKSSSADRFLIGDIYITPYICFMAERRVTEVYQSDLRFDMASILMDNTDGEGEIQYTILSDATQAATLSGSVVDMSAIQSSGDVVVQASWNDGLVTATDTLRVKYVYKGWPVVETFSNCLRRQAEGASYVIGDNELYDWNITNFTHELTDTVGGVRGFQIRHGGSISTNGAQEGGLRDVAFTWRAYQAQQPVHFVLTANGKSYNFTCSAAEAAGQIMTYNKALHITHNTAFSIAVGTKESPVQTPIVVGAVEVTPYLMFTVPYRVDTVHLADTTQYDLSAVLLDNTQGEGTIEYTILSDGTGVAQLSGATLDLSQVTDNGSVLVEASWGDVTTTMTVYAELYPTGINDPSADSPTSRFRKVFRNGQLLIIRDNQVFNAQGSRL